MSTVTVPPGRHRLAVLIGYSANEIAARAGCTPARVYQWMAREGRDGTRLWRRVIYSEADMLAFLARNRRPGRPSRCPTQNNC